MEILNKIWSFTRSEGLLGRCIRGGGFLTLGTFLDNLSRLIRNMILARLLAPEAFGLMATVISAVAALEAFAEVGLRQSVIQNKRGAEEGFLNITWWISSLRGLLLYVVAFVATPWICQFFNKPGATVALRIGFLVILMNGLMSPRIHVLEKQMRFGNWVLLNQAAGISGITVAIGSALLLRNIWALILGYITEAFFRLLLSFIFYSFKPGLKFDRECFREIMTFSRGMFGLPILMMLFLQTDVFVIGKVVSLNLLGMYVLAKSIADMPNTVISKIVNPVMLSALSSMQGEKRQLRNALLAVIKAVGIFGIPLIASLILYSKSILSLAYGQQYGALALPFSILCSYTFLLMCASINMEMYYSIGRPGIHRTASLVRAVLFLSIIYPLTKLFGLVGASVSILIAMSVALIIQLLYVRRILGIQPLEYFGTWTQGMKITALIVIAPGLIFKALVDHTAIQGLAFGAIFGLIAWIKGAIHLGMLNKKIFSTTKS